MLKMNAEEARRETIARYAALRCYPSQNEGYNTGSPLVAADANEYIQYYLSKWAQEGCANPHRAGVLFLHDECLAFTGSGNVLIYEVKPETVQTIGTAASIVSPAEMVKTVRGTFMLNISDSAQALKVSRPTVYQWDSLSDIEQIRAHKDRDRLKQLYRLAQSWTQRGQLLGRWLHETLSNGKSVLDLLSEEHIDEVELFSAHRQLLANRSRLLTAEHERSMAAAQSLKLAFSRMASNEESRKKDFP